MFTFEFHTYSSQVLELKREMLPFHGPEDRQRYYDASTPSNSAIPRFLNRLNCQFAEHEKGFEIVKMMSVSESLPMGLF